MDLKVKDVADLLNVTESTVENWIMGGIIPNYCINGEHHFSRTEVEGWVITQKLSKTDGISPFNHRQLNSTSTITSSGSKQYSLFRAIHKGDVLDHIAGHSKEEMIRSTMRHVAPHLHLDADMMSELLIDRENMMPTALNHGIGVPHTRESLLSAHHDAVVVVFPQAPLEYGALDGEPVHTLFFLFACEDKRHLHLLAKIAHLSDQPVARTFFQSKPSKGELLAFIKAWES